MDSHVDRTPGLGLPQPSPEQGAAASAPFESYRAPEAASVAAENAPMTPQAAPPLPPMAQAPVAAQPQAIVGMPPAAPMQATGTTVPADDDSDALDEEWVNKAKAIVEQTKTDPYIESRELGKAKADFLRIRYNKQIKVAEDK